MGSNREEKIDAWIFEQGIKEDRRRRIIPSSTDRITHQPVGTGLEAMENVARYFGDHPELPIVELGSINHERISLTFAHEIEMEEPFYQVSEDYRDQWAITHEDALALETGAAYGTQTAALTAVGNGPDGMKIMLNTARWQVLGSVGLAHFTSALMVGQVMEQATEPWAADLHIWLVGYHELGPKLVAFLSKHHQESSFHLVETIEQITADDLAGAPATIYVKDSSPATVEVYNRIRSEHTGLLTDTVATEQAMFISEDEDGLATIVNAGPHGLRIMPNLVGEQHELYQAMEVIWEKREEEAQSAASAFENISVEDFATEPSSSTDPEVDVSAETLEAMFNGPETGQTAKEDDPQNHPDLEQNAGTGAAEEDVASAEALEAMFNAPEAESAGADDQPQDPENTEELHSASSAAEADVSAETLEAMVNEPAAGKAIKEEQPQTPAESPDLSEHEEAGQVREESPESPARIQLSLMGKPEIHGATGESAGRAAGEAVAYLHLHGGHADVAAFSDAVWPDAENEGHAARIRRTRTAKRIRELLPDALSTENGWTLAPVRTDVDELLAHLEQGEETQEALEACATVQSPLEGCSEWADEHRQALREKITHHLNEAVGLALENDHFKLAKAAQKATKRL
ncbi:hypothetical protein K1Y78_48050 [Streptomyces sp. tea 10]|nr:hypothetical protein [Streptomyces sp. tea 10]